MNRTLLLGAAVAGLLGAATTAKADPIPKEKLKKMSVVACYGVNTCKALGQCSGENHDREVCPEVWELFRYAVHRFGPRPTIVEWDDRLPPFSTLLAETRRARAVLEEFFDVRLALAG